MIPGDGWARCTAGHQHWGRFGAAGLLVAAGGQVLLQHRAAWSDQGGTWGLPGGARHNGESPAAAALREAVEETGLPCGAVQLAAVELAALCGGWSYVTVVGRLAEPVPLRGGPEGSARWVPVDQVAALPLHPGLAFAWPHLRPLL